MFLFLYTIIKKKNSRNEKERKKTEKKLEKFKSEIIEEKKINLINLI